LGPIPNPQSPIPNPQSPSPFKNNILLFQFKKLKLFPKFIQKIKIKFKNNYKEKK